MTNDLTIIIPVYNEEDNLVRLEAELCHFMQSTTIPISVLFINDGSTDNSESQIETICERHANFNYVSLADNSGISTALKVGFDHCDTALVGYLDADLQTSPTDFNTLLASINSCDMVIGIRSDRQDSIVKRWSSKIANSIRRTFTKDGIKDTGCPLKIIHTPFAKRIPMFKGMHRFLPALVQLQGGLVKQVPVPHYPRLEGTSKFGLGNRLIQPLIDCFAFLWIKKRYIDYRIRKTDL